MQLRTGKSGRYRYYTCSTCARQGKTVCKGRSVPMDTLDGLVLDHPARRLFTPERLAILLAQHADATRSGAEEWAQRAKAANKELRDVNDRIQRLYELVERGLTPLDDTLQNRLTELRQQREEALRRKSVAERQKGLQRQVLAPERMAEFCAAMRGQLRDANIAVRKAYLRLFIERIEVDDAEIRMFGHKGSLEAGIRLGTDGVDGSVPSFVREWRPLRDSDPCYRRESPKILKEMRGRSQTTESDRRFGARLVGQLSSFGSSI
jgi:site-specific DNA recombinase